MTNIVYNKNGVAFDIDAIATDLNGKLDRDLTNINEAVKKVIDGQWVFTSSYALANETSWNNSYTQPEMSFATYLPNDGCIYEVYFLANCTTGSTSGQFIRVNLSSDIVLVDIFICSALTRASSTMSGYGNAIIPVGTGRWVKQYKSTSANANGTFNLWAIGYRRIGSNS